MVRVKTESGCSEPFAKRKGFDEVGPEARSNPVVFVVTAVLGWIYTSPVQEATLRYVSFGAGVGALGGIALSGAGSYFDRLLALDATAVGTFVVVAASVVVWIWYLAAVARKQRGEGVGSPTWMVWLFGFGYASLMILLFLVAAAPIFR